MVVLIFIGDYEIRGGFSVTLGGANPRARERERERKSVSRDLDTVSESHGGLLAHIIDSRVAARDAPALLCSVERWQEAWFRDNSFLIACLIHTIRNYTAVPCAYARSRNHSREHPGTRPFVRVSSYIAPLFCFRADFPTVFARSLNFARAALMIYGEHRKTIRISRWRRQ